MTGVKKQSPRLECLGANSTLCEHPSHKRLISEETTPLSEHQPQEEVRIWIAEGQIWDSKSRGPGNVVCLFFNYLPSSRAGQYPWITFLDVGQNLVSINTIQEYGMPERDLVVLCLLLIQKKLLCFHFTGWFTNYNCSLQWCKLVWLFQ